MRARPQFIIKLGGRQIRNARIQLTKVNYEEAYSRHGDTMSVQVTFQSRGSVGAIQE